MKMGPDFASENCFTCSKNPANFHIISNSVGNSNPNIRYIFCQHFWFEEDDLRSAIVCETCWEKVDQFHRFYLDVEKLHKHREVVPLSTFIKQEEITIEETQLQENYMGISAENQKLLDTADCKLEISDESSELPKKEEPAEVFPQLRNKIKYARRLSNQRVVKRKNPHSRKLLTPEEQQAEEDFIKQHTRYICDECNIEFESFRAIKFHRIKAHKKIAFACCSTQHRTRATLYQHVQSFLDPEAFKCEICGNTLKSQTNYVRHKELYHAAEKDLVFKCNRCPKSFIKEWLLKSHLAEHETLENETAKCEFCGKCYRNKSRLNKHIKVTHKKQMDFICEICSKGFYLRGMFLEHHKTHELTEEQLKEQCKCKVCGHVSSNVLSLKRHMKSRHALDRKTHACELCDKEYSRPIYLKEHVANAHTREHLYQCQHCEKKFFYRSTMYSHQCSGRG